LIVQKQSASIFLLALKFGVLFFLWSATSSFAQTRCKTIYKQPFQALDSFLVVPNTLHIKGRNTPLPYFDILKQVFLWPDSLGVDSLEICYSVIPGLKKAYFNRDINRYLGLKYYMERPESDLPNLPAQELFSTPKLNKSGSLTRGVSFGNTQNAFVNSQLNLQLQGMLSDDIKLTAVINDQKVPYQPEGNTQNIRQFDMVYIQLEHKKANLIAGDVVLNNTPESQFLKYYKNIQGGSLQLNLGDSTKPSQTQFAAGVAKGKFASIILTPIDGVQGPYRLQIPEAEGFIVINSNTERVFIDGVLLKRGFNQDYIIDYNQGEIIFNNQIIITRYSRLRVDFEYVTREYNRSIYSLGHYQPYKTGSIRLMHYQEQDNENKPTGFTPNDTLIKDLGNTLSGNVAFVSGATKVTDFSTDQVLYTKVASPDVFGDSIFRQTSVATNTMYAVSFTQTIAGDYNLKQGSNNGRVYEYVGKGKGSYLPLRRIALPNKKAVTQLSWKQKTAKKQFLNSTIAYSQQNANLYNQTDATNKEGLALNTGYYLENRMLRNGYQWNANTQYELLQQNFKAIDRFRSIEFEREWNGYNGDTLTADDHLLSTQVNIKKPVNGSVGERSVQANLKHRNKGDNVNGYMADATINYGIGKLNLAGNQYLMQNKTSNRLANWYRSTIKATYKTKLFTPSYQYQLEKNSIAKTGTDSIIATANNFDSHTLAISNADSAKQIFGISFNNRTDRLPLEGKLTEASKAYNYSASSTFKGEGDRKFAFLFTYRNLKSLNPNLSLTNAAEENAIQGRADWQGTYLKNCLRNELTYTLNNGRELQKEYRFIKAPILGEGTHFYLGDVNGNGLQDLDEFVIATRPEQREYIKIFVSTNTYIKAFSNQLIYRLNLQPPSKWKNKKGVTQFVSKLSNNSSLQADQKSTANELTTRVNPLSNANELNLISFNRLLKSSLFFDRSNPNQGAEIAFNTANNKQLNTNGFETRKIKEWRALARKNLGMYHNVQLLLTQSQKIAESDFLTTRNFKIEQRGVGPEYSFQPSSKIRITFNGQLNWKKNTIGIEKAFTRKIGTELRYNKATGSNLNTSINLIQISFEGNPLSQVAYELNDGLRNGQNLTWNVNWQQKLTDGLQLLLNYDGRKSQNSSVVHIGRVQVTALF